LGGSQKVAVFVEIKPKLPTETLDPISLPLMHLTLLLRTLRDAPHEKARRPILITLEADLPTEVWWLMQAFRPQLKQCGVSLLVHAKSVSEVRKGLGIEAQTWLSEAFDTVIMTKPDDLTFLHVVNMRRVPESAISSVRKGEIVAVSASQTPVRLHPVYPAMLPALASSPTHKSTDAPAPWGAPAIAYPLGASFPKPKFVRISKPREKVMATPNSASATSNIQLERPDKLPTNPLVNKDDLASSTARLTRALAKRTAAPSQTQSRII
jgi:hypothetical protein